MSGENARDVTRREWMKIAAAGGLGLAGLTSCGPGGSPVGGMAGPAPRHNTVTGMAFEPRATVRVGVIGVGPRGTAHVRALVHVPNVELAAVADIDAEHARAAQLVASEAGKPTPTAYTRGERDFERMLASESLDLVYIATPWDWHVPMALAAMSAGTHVGVEVSVGHTIEDLWSLVDASERTRRHCIILENVCYGREELMILNMVRSGLLGELKHAEAAYIHELRERLFDDTRFSRRAYHISRNGNLYPTHGLGPVALDLNINRGDRFGYLVSMSSPQLQLDAYRREHLPADDPRHREVYSAGDINTSLIKTALGRTIVLQHDVVSPRPYTRINLVSGTRGIVRGYPEPMIYLDPLADGTSAEPGDTHSWRSLDEFRARYEHRFWREIGEIARQQGGHGGMDYLMTYRLIQTIRNGDVPDLDVYDTAAWHAAGPLSARSAENGSAPVEFPDFTRGHWRQERTTM